MASCMNLYVAVFVFRFDNIWYGKASYIDKNIAGR